MARKTTYPFGIILTFFMGINFYFSYCNNSSQLLIVAKIETKMLAEAPPQPGPYTLTLNEGAFRRGINENLTFPVCYDDPLKIWEIRW